MCIYDIFSENWVKCDDDKISHISAEEVLKLSGGGKPNSNFNLNHKPITPILTSKLYLFFIIVIWKIANTKYLIFLFIQVTGIVLMFSYTVQDDLKY